MLMTYCKGCLEKQREIDELKEEIARLKAKQRYQEIRELVDWLIGEW